jgi:hypothetical protein
MQKNGAQLVWVGKVAGVAEPASKWARSKREYIA